MEQWQHKSDSSMKMWLKKNFPFMNYFQKVSRTQQDTNVRDIRTFFIGQFMTAVTQSFKRSQKTYGRK
eukprot:13050981-Ditylum_brightwellii.AAC.1